MQLSFFCTRPVLAETLIRKGFEGELTINPWSADRSAWKFAVNAELAAAVRAFYTGIGKPLPQSAAQVFGALGV